MLDLQAAQAVVRAKLLERATHDPGPWTVRIGSHTFPAVRVKTPTSVRFLIIVDETPDSDVAFLAVGGEEISSWDLTGMMPTDGGFNLQWKLTAPAEPEFVGA